MWHYYHNYHWNHLWQWPYPCNTWSNKAIHIRKLGLKVNQFRGNNPEHDITKQLFIPYLMLFKRNKRKNNRQYHWAYQLLLSPNKPITHWFYIEVMGIMTKTPLSMQSLYILLYNVAYVSLWCYLRNTRSHTPLNFYFFRYGWIQSTKERDVSGKIFLIDPINYQSGNIIGDS